MGHLLFGVCRLAMAYQFLLSVFGLPLIEKFTDSNYWSIYKQFRALDRNSQEQQGNYQLEQLSQLLSKANCRDIMPLYLRKSCTE